MPCSVCEAPPHAPAGPLTLHCWIGLGHSSGKVVQAAEEAGLTAKSDVATGALTIEAEAEGLRDALERIGAALSSVEREAIRIIAAPRDAAVGLRDVARMLTLDQSLARVRNGWLLDALRGERLEVAFEPIAHADSPDEIFAHEAVAGVVDAGGRRVERLALYDAAESADVLAALDRQCRLGAIRAAGARRVEGPVVVGFSPSAIYDPRFCLRTTVAAAEADGVARDSIVFSILPAAAGADVDHLAGILGYYVENGFRTALNISASRGASFEMLQRLKPDMIFVDESLAANVTRDAFKEVVARKVLEIAHRLQIETVVSGVVSAEDADWAYAQGATYLQGPFVASAVAGAQLAAS